MNAKQIQHIEKVIVINAPLQCVYNQCMQFEEFSRFAPYAISARQFNDSQSMVQIRFWGKRSRQRTDIYQIISDHSNTRHGPGCRFHHGTITFESEGKNTTCVTVEIDYEPCFPIGKASVAPVAMERRIGAMLKRFRSFIEPPPAATEEWRGEIHNDGVQFAESDAYAWTRY